MMWEVVIYTFDQKFLDRREFTSRDAAYFWANTHRGCVVEIYGPGGEYDGGEQ